MWKCACCQGVAFMSITIWIAVFPVEPVASVHGHIQTLAAPPGYYQLSGPVVPVTSAPCLDRP